MLIPKWNKKTFETIEDVVLRASVVSKSGELFKRKVLFRINALMEMSENIEMDFVVKKAVYAQNMFL
jgi:hypothetical protein